MEVEQLAKAIEKNDPKLIQFWGAEVYRWTQDIQVQMVKQLKWIESQLPARDITELGSDDLRRAASDQYEKRLAQWLTTLRQYERGCDLLVKAEEML